MAECSKDYVDLWWECPDSDGGSPVVQYIIEKCDVSRAAGGSNMWMVCGTVAATELSVRVGKLLQGNSYLFRVSAENRVGPGPPTELQQPVVAELPYSALYFYPPHCFSLCLTSLVFLNVQQNSRHLVCVSCDIRCLKHKQSLTVCI